MNEPAIVTKDLTRTFGPVVAVDRLNLGVAKGSLFGIVGPDGGGKSTVMRMLAAIMEPTSGGAWVAGLSVTGDGEGVKERIGYMSQRFGLYEDLTVIENIDFYADLYEVPKKERQQRIERLLGFSNLTPFRGRLAGRLSGGMKQKLGLACALVHTPEVLLLDEPTNGVDPVSRRDFWKILYDLLKEGITIFISTAYLDEAERCTRVGLMHNGRLLMEETPDAIKRSLGRPMIELWSDNPRKAAEVLRSCRGIGGISIYGQKLHITIEKEEFSCDTVSLMRDKGIEVKGYREILPSLEDVFIAKVKEL